MLPSASQEPVRQLRYGDPRPLPPEGEKSKNQRWEVFTHPQISPNKLSCPGAPPNFKIERWVFFLLSPPSYISNISGTFDTLFCNNFSCFPAQVNNLNWHLGCLECSVCRASLRQHNSCYVKNKEIFCKLDYFR